MSVLYNGNNVKIDLNIPIYYLLIKCNTFQGANPIPDITCPVYYEQSTTYTDCKMCFKSVCCKCYDYMASIKNKKCPLCNTDSSEYVYE